MPEPTARPPRRRAGDILRDLELAGAEARAGPATAQGAIAAGSIGYGAGGPVWLDQFRSKRAPSPTELLEQVKAVAYACISMNAWAVADVPLRLYCRTGPGDRAPRRAVAAVPRARLDYLMRHRSLHRAILGATDVHEVAEHPWLEALDTPNPFFDGPALLFYLCACLDALGRFYFYPERVDRTWAAGTWWPLQPQYVLPVKGAPGTILREYTYFGRPFAPDELETGKFVSLRDPYLSGYAPLHACYEQLGLYNAYAASVEDLLKGGARPSGLVGPADALDRWTDEQRRRVEALAQDHYGGGRQGRLWVVDGGYKYTPLSYSPVDLGGLELAKNARLAAANCFGVPISLLQSEDSNRAVAEAGNYQHQRNAVRPRCTAIAGALTQMARAVDPRYFFAFDNPVQRDELARAKVIDMRVRNNTLLVDEARDEDGLPAVAWGRAKFARMADDAPDPTAAGPKPPGDEPPPKGKGKGKGGDETDDAERSLVVGLARLAARIEGRLDAEDDARRRRPRARGDRRLAGAGAGPPDGDRPIGGDGAAGGCA
jgi:phage portal protein BeeE